MTQAFGPDLRVMNPVVEKYLSGQNKENQQSNARLNKPDIALPSLLDELKRNERTRESK